MAKINNIYLYVKKDEAINCAKYGIKLSEYSDIFLNNKKGIIANFSPKDSNKYENSEYSILRIYNKDINLLVLDKETNSTFKLTEYDLGSIKNPKIIILTSILPENIYLYNMVLDVPLIIDSSEELYEMIEEEKELENMNINFSMLKNGIKN